MITDLPANRYDHSSYYTRANAQSAALLRARRPYLVRNAVTGLIMAGIATGVCMSTLLPRRRYDSGVEN